MMSAEPREARRPWSPQRWPLASVMPPVGALPTAARAARGHVRDALSQWRLTGFSETGELIASELVTNSVLAGTGADGMPAYADGRLAVVQLSVFSDRTEVLIEVWDQAAALPVPKQAGAGDESGRGLAIVGMLADWGSFPHRGGKIVYARFPKAA